MGQALDERWWHGHDLERNIPDMFLTLLQNNDIYASSIACRKDRSC
jgi:hypothetical protein